MSTIKLKACVATFLISTLSLKLFYNKERGMTLELSIV